MDILGIASHIVWSLTFFQSTGGWLCPDLTTATFSSPAVSSEVTLSSFWYSDLSFWWFWSRLLYWFLKMSRHVSSNYRRRGGDLLEDVELRGAVGPVGGVALGGDSAVDQHDLDQDALLAEVPQTLDVVTHITTQPLGPALLKGYNKMQCT